MFSRPNCSELSLMVVSCWEGWTHLFLSPGFRCYFFSLALLLSPPNCEPLQGVPFLQKPYPSLLPMQRKTFCCCRSLRWIPESSWKMLLLVQGRTCSDHFSCDLKLYPDLIWNCIPIWGNLLLCGLGLLFGICEDANRTSLHLPELQFSCLMRVYRVLTS